MRYVPSATLRTMVVYGTSGLAFAGANLLLARVLSTEHYALLTLVVALMTLGYHLAPAGLDALVTRGRVDVGPALLRRVSMTAALIGTGATAVAFTAYGLSTVTAALLLAGTAAGGVMLVAAAHFQSDQRFTLSNGIHYIAELAVADRRARGARDGIAHGDPAGRDSDARPRGRRSRRLGARIDRAPSVGAERFSQYRGTKRWRSRV